MLNSKKNGLNTKLLDKLEFSPQNGTIPTMSERNPCKASGCPGLCCQNIALELTRFERSRIFPNAIRVNTIQELRKLKNNKVSGVFYTRYRRVNLRSSGFVIIQLNGSCPNKSTDGKCLIHEERSHAARNFQIGCKECNSIRKEHGLGPILIEAVK